MYCTSHIIFIITNKCTINITKIIKIKRKNLFLVSLCAHTYTHTHTFLYLSHRTQNTMCLHAYTYNPVNIHIHDSSWLSYCNSVIINSHIICFCRNIVMYWSLGYCTLWLIFILFNKSSDSIQLYINMRFFLNTVCQWLFLAKETVKNGHWDVQWHTTWIPSAKIPALMPESLWCWCLCLNCTCCS